MQRDARRPEAQRGRPIRNRNVHPAHRVDISIARPSNRFDVAVCHEHYRLALQLGHQKTNVA